MRVISTSEAIREALAQEMYLDERVFLMGEDIGMYGGAFGVTRGLLERFGGGRVIETPISEAGFVGVAIGAALLGRRPVVEIMFSDFIFLAMDQLVNHAAKFRYVYGEQAPVPLVVRTPGGCGRAYGPTHSQAVEGYFVHTPGIKVVAPSTPYDAKGLLLASIRDPNPVVFIENRTLYPQKGEVPEKDYTLPLGKAAVVRVGGDVTVVAYSRMVHEALAAAETLADEGISLEVIDLRTLSPLDAETVLASVKKTGRTILVEEGPRTAGVMAEVAARIAEDAFDYLDAPVKRLTMPDIPVPCAAALEQAALPSRDDIVRTARELCG
ncbi:MAG TPA: alpha-ketoacid dehydrogenase subunit beta [Planctomycetota bacterium]|nr:alpha-ketoacid dehydrogenase subunit beta [Planctomycetota bacterium]